MDKMIPRKIVAAYLMGQNASDFFEFDSNVSAHHWWDKDPSVDHNDPQQWTPFFRARVIKWIAENLW